MLLPARIVAPAAALLTVAEARAQSRITEADDDAVLAGLIAAVTALLDGPSGVLSRALVTQTWTQAFGGLGDVLRLPLAPVQSFSVSYLDEAGAPQPLTGAYRLHTDVLGAYLVRTEGTIFPATARRDDAVTVTMVCGYGAPADVPADIRTAALMLVAHFYEHREAVGVTAFQEMPLGAQWLLERHRRVGI